MVPKDSFLFSEVSFSEDLFSEYLFSEDSFSEDSLSLPSLPVVSHSVAASLPDVVESSLEELGPLPQLEESVLTTCNSSINGFPVSVKLVACNWSAINRMASSG